MRNTLIFAGSSCPVLTQQLCDKLGMIPAQSELTHFSNGETSVRLLASVREKDVFIVQSGSRKINDTIMELLIMISACKGGSANKITAVVPYFPYSRQSKKKTQRAAITARMLANLLSVAGVKHVITVDLHASQMQGFFRCPVDNLHAEPLIARWIRHNIPNWREGVVVSKNAGGTKRVASLADALKLNIGIVTTAKRRSTQQQQQHQMYNSPSLAMLAPLDSVDRRPRLESSRRTTSGLTQQLVNRAKSLGKSPLHSEIPSSIPPTPTTSTSHVASTLPPSNSTDTTTTRSSQDSNLPVPSSPDTTTSTTPTALLSPATPSKQRRSSSVQPRAIPQGGLGERPADDDGSALLSSSARSDGFVGSYDDGPAEEVTHGRLFQGHIIDDDDFASPSTTGSTTFVESPVRSSSLGNGSEEGGHGGRLPSELDPSILSLSSPPLYASPQPETVTAGADDSESDEEEDHLQDPKMEHMVTLVGDVRNRPVFIVDDMIDKPGSWIAAAETVVKRGKAKKVYCFATHGVFGGDCLAELQACDCIDAIIVTNSFPISEEQARSAPKLLVLDLSFLLAEAIRRNHYGESISPLFQHVSD